MTYLPPQSVSDDGGVDTSDTHVTRWATLRIHREVNRAMDWAYLNARFRVIIDGERIGQVRAGDAQAFKITPGVHRIRIGFMIWRGTGYRPFSIDVGQEVEFSCRLGWSGFVIVRSTPAVGAIDHE
jgi:hypothetical protein